MSHLKRSQFTTLIRLSWLCGEWNPGLAMRNFAEWVKAVTPPGSRPIFVGLNVAFDWMFVADYFYRYLGTNPFGHSALDIKALFMGTRRVSMVRNFV
jgi:hypothetical protein